MAEITATLLNSLTAVNKIANSSGWDDGNFTAMYSVALDFAGSALLHCNITSSVSVYRCRNTRVIGHMNPVPISAPTDYAGLSAGAYIASTQSYTSWEAVQNTTLHFENMGIDMLAPATSMFLFGGESQHVIFNNVVFGKYATTGTTNLINTTSGSYGQTRVTFNNCMFIAKYGASSAEVIAIKTPDSVYTFNNCLFYDVNGNATMIKVNTTATNSAVSINGCRFYNSYNGVINAAAGTAVNVTGCIFDTVGNAATTAVTAVSGNVTL